MHKVDAQILNINEDTDLPLSKVNKFTIANNGTSTVQFGFKDTYVDLTTGQATGFESGANAWFDENVVLKVRFKNPLNTDSKVCTVMICTIVKPANIFANALK